MSRSTNNSKFMAWLICGIGVLFYSYEYLLRVTPRLIDTELMQHYAIDAASFGILSSFYYVAYTPMQLPVGMLMDRFGPRRLLAIACSICILGTCLFIATNSFTMASAGRFLVGVGSAFAFVGVLKLATIWLPPDRFAMIAGLATALGTFFGSMLGGQAMALFVEKVGLKPMIYGSAALGIVVLAAILAIVHDDSKARDHRHEQHGTVTTLRQLLMDTKIVLLNPLIWVNGLIGCLIYLPTTIFGELWGDAYLKSAFGFSTSDAEWGIFALFGGFTLASPLMGWLSDKLHNRRLPLFFGAIGAAILFAILLYVPGHTPRMVFTLLFFIGVMYSAQPIVFAIAREVSPEEVSGTAVAITNLIIMLAPIILQPLVGKLLVMRISGVSDAHAIYQYAVQDFKVALSLIPAGILISAFLTLVIKETHAKVHR